MRGSMKAFSSPASLAVLACSVLIVTGQQPSTAGPFTAEQANAGRGGVPGELRRLSRRRSDGRIRRSRGAAFVGGWGTRTTRDLFGLIQTTMPTDRPGALPDDTYVNIVAFILQSNGRTPGTQPLTADDRRWPIGGDRAAPARGTCTQAAQAAQAPSAAADARPDARGSRAVRGGGRGQPQAPRRPDSPSRAK